MFDTTVRSLIDPTLNRMGAQLARAGVSANAVTWLGFAVGTMAAFAIASGYYTTGMLLILLSRLCDGLDGAVARADVGSSAVTDFGGYLDIVLDFGFYGMIPLAFIIADPAANAVAGAALLLVFYINGASFLTYALMAEKRGLEEGARGSKSLLYTTGLAEATETIAVFVLFCIFPQWFSIIASIFAVVVLITTIMRFVLAYREFD